MRVELTVEDDDCYFIDDNLDTEAFVLDNTFVKKEPSTPSSAIGYGNTMLHS